jgi:hypothetical protein
MQGQASENIPKETLLQMIKKLRVFPASLRKLESRQ